MIREASDLVETFNGAHARVEIVGSEQAADSAGQVATAARSWALASAMPTCTARRSQSMKPPPSSMWEDSPHNARSNDRTPVSYQQPYSQAPYPPMRPVKKKVNPWLIGCGTLFGVAVLGGGCMAVLGAAISKNAPAASGSPSAVAASSPAVVVATKAAAKAKATVAPKPVAPPQPKIVLTVSGNGIKTTQSFSVTGDWDLQYSYDCASFGSQGNFAVSDDTGMPLINELGAKGSDTTHQHGGAGKMYLSVNSECQWKIKVVQLPG
jgi:hypothetical protein